jgi:hypothetical protein
MKSQLCLLNSQVLQEHTVTICQNCKVVALDIHEREYGIFPTINQKQFAIVADSVLIDSVCAVDNRESNIVEQCLEGRNRSTLVGEKGSESVRTRDAQGKNLAM